jgi:hypothetical protein
MTLFTQLGKNNVGKTNCFTANQITDLYLYLLNKLSTQFRQHRQLIVSVLTSDLVDRGFEPW